MNVAQDVYDGAVALDLAPRLCPRIGRDRRRLVAGLPILLGCFNRVGVSANGAPATGGGRS